MRIRNTAPTHSTQQHLQAMRIYLTRPQITQLVALSLMPAVLHTLNALGTAPEEIILTCSSYFRFGNHVILCTYTLQGYHLYIIIQKLK